MIKVQQRQAAFALVLGGGNALGAYQAGVYEALHTQGFSPDWIAGTSVGAVNGAIIAGSAAGARLSRLRDLWQPSSVSDGCWLNSFETLRRTSAAATTMALGRPGIFAPVSYLGSWWMEDPIAGGPALFNQSPLGDTLDRLVDVAQLNSGTPRYTACAVDLESGEDLFFDSAAFPVSAEQVRASAALMPTFAPVAIEDRLLVDGGVSANVPIDAVLREPPTTPLLCIAVDLMPIASGRPWTLGEAVGRSQDLMFAVQTRRAIDHWKHVYAHDPRFAESAVTLIRLAYRDQDQEVAGKAMDFSPETVRRRWDAGRRDATAVLNRIASGDVAVAPGLTIDLGEP
jgi:NTE family protein